MTDDLKIIESKIKYTFKNKDLLLQALTRKSYSEENGGQNNEVLEFIGDKVIDLVVIKELMEKFGTILDEEVSNFHYFVTPYGEGKFTDIKKYFVEGETLSEKMTNLGFQKYLRMGKGDIAKQINEEKSVKEDLLEAIVGAVAIDSKFNFPVLNQVVNRMLELKKMLENDFEFLDCITRINNFCLKINHEPPHYEYEKEEDYDYYTCSLSIPSLDKEYKGSGYSEKKARFECAKEAYEGLEDEGYFAEEMKDVVGDPCLVTAVDQLEKLFQKKYFSKPNYEFISLIDNDKVLWKCNCFICDYPFSFDGVASSKKEAKKKAAFNMLKYVI